MPKHKQESTPEPDATKLQTEYKRGDDFFGEYANNVHLLSTNWDLKVIFGELDQTLGPNTVIQKFAVTLPWAQAKVLQYFLTMHVFGHEADYGRIVIPAGIVPPLPDKQPEGINDIVWEKANKMYADFIAQNPEAAPHK